MKYGPGCKKTCGNCSNAEQCHHVNGSCLNGCDVGVFGDRCNQSKIIKVSNDQTYLKRKREMHKKFSVSYG